MVVVELSVEQVQNVLAVLRSVPVRGDSVDEFIKLRDVFVKVAESVQPVTGVKPKSE